MLSNSIEYANWVANPVEPIVCELCWSAGCAQAGLARIVRVSDKMLWLPPRLCDMDAFLRDLIGEDNFIRESILMPIGTWDGLREKFQKLPAAQTYPQITRRDIATVWLAEMPEAVRVAELGGLALRLTEFLASDPLDPEPARETVQSMVEWIFQSPDLPVEGQILPSHGYEAEVNTFYFDGPPFHQWRAFVVGFANSFALGDDFVFVSG